jgi:hypothetical protein
VSGVSTESGLAKEDEIHTPDALPAKTTLAKARKEILSVHKVRYWLCYLSPKTKDQVRDPKEHERRQRMIEGRLRPGGGGLIKKEPDTLRPLGAPWEGGK